jgi:hypothetical protein
LFAAQNNKKFFSQLKFLPPSKEVAHSQITNNSSLTHSVKAGTSRDCAEISLELAKMSLDPNSQSSTANSVLNAIASPQQQYSQQLSQNQFYQQQVQQQQQRTQQQQRLTQQQLSQQYAQTQQQLTNAFSQASYAQTAHQLAQHLPQGTVLAPQQQSLQQIVLPQSEFVTRDELVTYIHTFARENGFGIVISHSNEKAIYFTCELGGTYRNKRNINDKERKRKLTTRKINCPFSMVANCKKNEQDEVVKWVLRVTNPDHNHDKLNLNESFPMLRRRNPEINRQIRELYLKGNKPLVIEKILKDTFKNILINREDIYNETRKMKREEKLKNSEGLTSPQDHQVSLKADDSSFEQNIPNLLQQGLPLNLNSQYQALQPPQNQQGFQQQALYHSNVVNQAIANAQQNPPKEDDPNLSNIDINLVKQQGL